MAKLTIDVDGADRTIRSIKRDLHRGMEKTVDTLVDNARSEARKVISEERAIFNSEVYAGFKDAEVKNNPTTVRKKLYNDVDHADPLEEGATYTDSGPPVQALLPWVARKMRVGSSFDPDSYNNNSGGGSGGGGRDSQYEEDTQAVDQDTIDKDTTDEGLTLSKQADDISIESGNSDTLDERGARESLFTVNEWQQERGMPNVDSFSGGVHETVEDAFDDSNTITVPGNLLEWDSEFTGANFESLFDEEYYNVSYDTHLSYVIDHQYGAYIYDNLSDAGLNEFRSRWGFTEVDGNWELPDDASQISELAAKNERRFFAEVVVGEIREGFGYRESQKRDYFERIYDLDEGFFNSDFLDKPRDSPGYNIGYDYSGDREVVLEEHIGDYSTTKTDKFTTDFNNYHYVEEGPNGQGFKDYSEYIATSPMFEGAKVVEYFDGRFNDPNSGSNYEFDQLTIQAIPEGEKVFNYLQREDNIIIDNTDGILSGNEYLSVKIKNNQQQVWQQSITEGENVFTGDAVEIHPQDIVGWKKENQDLWADGYETVDTVTESELDSRLSDDIEFVGVGYNEVRRTVNDVGHIVLTDKDSGDSYKAVRSNSNNATYESLHPNENGDLLQWDEADVNITHLSERVVRYDSIEAGDNILVEPDSLEYDSNFTDTTYRATVDRLSASGQPLVQPFGQSTKARDEVNYNAFINKRDDIPGWDSKNWEKGRKVTVETNYGDKTGRIISPENTFGIKKPYEADRMRMVVDDGNEYYFDTTDIISSGTSNERDKFMKSGSNPNNIDFDVTEYTYYDGELDQSYFSPGEFRPLDGVKFLDEGTEIKSEGRSEKGVISSKLSDGRYVVNYYDDSGELIGNDRVKPRRITFFDGMGANEADLEEGVTISTGSSFGEIVGVRDESTKAYEIDFDGDGDYEDILTADQIATTDFSVPEGVMVWFWSYRDEEWKTGTVTKSTDFKKEIETEDGKQYSTNSDVYPIKIRGVNL